MRHGAGKLQIFIDITLEKYSSGRRGAPAKGIGRVTGARVQIPPSPFTKMCGMTDNIRKHRLVKKL